MKKIITLFFVAVFVQSFICTVGISENLKSIGQNFDIDDSITISLSYPDFEIVEDEGKHTINMEGYNYLTEPGKPLLPSKKILIALPPDSIAESVYVNGLNIRQVPGFYQIKPASKALPDCSGFLDEKHLEEIDKEWNENYAITYSSDNPYPGIAGELFSQGTYHKIAYVSVNLYPFVYHPASGKLFSYDSVEIIVNYECKDNGNLRYDKEIENVASELFLNFDDVRNLYQPFINPPNKNNYNYVIITSNSLYDSIILSNFINWKSSIGFNTKILNITDSLIISQQGFDLAEQIRNFLRNNYADWGIEYVLLVGNYTNVPMRYCFPDRYNHEFNLSNVFGGEFPTDSYYADLSYPDEQSWDSDGDGFYGEYQDDNLDFLAEVSVGRIPTNDDNKVVYTLEKIIAFEQDTAEWKNNVLHAGAIILFNPFDDGAVAIDNIEKDLMNGMTISHYCEKEGLKTSEYSWVPLEEETFTNDWKTGKYGIVNWAAHGWSNVALRLLWLNDDDGDGRPDEDEIECKNIVNTDSDLDDDYPSIIFTISCMIGYPEPSPDDWPDNRKGNLGVDILTKPSFGTSVSIMCGTRITYLTPEYVNDHICYRFNQNLIINHESVGDAFYNAKFDYLQNTGAPGTWKYTNLFSYNLYGDPSLIYEGVAIEGKPEKPIISGPANCKPNEEYSYSAVANDPDNDKLFYYFKWGDGKYSEWLGPFGSGEECNASHTWNKQGNYEIKVRVRDDNGYFSDWSDPLEVSMPRNIISIRI